MARGVPVKEIVGISSFVSKSNGRTGYNLFCVEPFPTDMENCEGMQVSKEFTYDDYGLQVGDRVKIFKDVIETAKGTYPVIQEIVKVPPAK